MAMSFAGATIVAKTTIWSIPPCSAIPGRTCVRGPTLSSASLPPRTSSFVPPRTAPATVTFTASLAEDDNEILVRFEEVAARECPYAMALRVVGVDPDDVEVRIPSATERTVRHMMLERVFEQASIESTANYRGRV